MFITFLLLSYYEVEYDNETDTTITWSINGAEDEELFRLDYGEEEKSIGHVVYISVISNLIALFLVVLGAVVGLYLKRLYNKHCS